MAEIKDRERSIKDLMNTYKHFTGTMEEVCRAGVNYEDVKDRHPDRTDLAPAYRFALPCFERHLPRPRLDRRSYRKSKQWITFGEL